MDISSWFPKMISKIPPPPLPTTAIGARFTSRRISRKTGILPHLQTAQGQIQFGLREKAPVLWGFILHKVLPLLMSSRMIGKNCGKTNGRASPGKMTGGKIPGGKMIPPMLPPRVTSGLKKRVQLPRT